MVLNGSVLQSLGEDWVSILQKQPASLVSDEEMEEASVRYLLNKPQTEKEMFESHFPKMCHATKTPGLAMRMTSPQHTEIEVEQKLFLGSSASDMTALESRLVFLGFSEEKGSSYIHELVL